AIYADTIVRSSGTGAADSGEVNPYQFRADVHFALGGVQGRGGLGSGSYGRQTPNGQPPQVLLPSGMSQQEFDLRMSVLPTRAGDIGIWRGAVNGAPRWGDGRPMSMNDLRS